MRPVLFFLDVSFLYVVNSYNITEIWIAILGHLQNYTADFNKQFSQYKNRASKDRFVAISVLHSQI